MEQRKLLKSRIERLTDEVNELHPLLAEIFNRMESIDHVSHTHGVHERGADFVLTRTTQEFGDTEYVGVIVKVGKLTANLSSVEEQIKECMEQRLRSDGRTKIYLSSIWVVCNGNISERAREKIYERYKTHKLRFLPLEALVDLAEKYIPDFGTNLNVKDSAFLAKERESAKRRELQFSLLPATSQNLFVDQKIIRRDKSEHGGFGSERIRADIFEEVVNHSALLVEAPMGGGKTTLLNRIVMHFADPEVYAAERIMPVYMTCSELLERGDLTLSRLLSTLCEENGLAEDADRTALVLLDGLDEVQDESPDQVDQLISAIADGVHGDPSCKVKFVIASRGIGDEKLRASLERQFRKYEIVPLSLTQILIFVSEICGTLNVKSRLIEDLKESSLFKVLPRTPIAAIILAKLLSEGHEEIPANLTELYAQYCELALGRWDADKGLSSLKDYEASDAILADLSSYILDNSLQHVAYSEAEGFFRDYLSERNLSIDPSELFDSVLKRSGILVFQNELNVVAFKHRSFTEFYYAKNLLRKDNVDISEKIFHPYWSNAYFFYVGQKKDCPDLLEKICNTEVSVEGARLSKMISLGSFLLAGYKSPYYAIEKSIGMVFEEARKYYLEVRDAQIDSFLSPIPAVHLLALFRAILEDNYGYLFFKNAIEERTNQIAGKKTLLEGDLYELVLLDATRNQLGVTAPIEVLTNAGKKKEVLPVAVQMVICSPQQLKTPQAKLLRPLEKRMRKQMRNSRRFTQAVYDASHRSIDGKVEYPDSGKRLEETSKYAGGRKSGRATGKRKR